MTIASHRDDGFELLDADRRRLVGLCLRITGNANVAEDLAQESLTAAWRNADTLRNPDARQAWLAGIARNICKGWLRAHAREQARRAHVDGLATSDDWGTDDFDLELELERDELATLLDRALELLPVETRLALIHRYVEGHPQAAVAEHLGLSEGAVAMRLQRGKLTLRRILATDLHADASAYGIVGEDSWLWQPTRIWCSMCGTNRLVGRFDATEGTLVLRCPACFERFALYDAQSYHEPDLFAGLKGTTAAYRRLLAASDVFQRQAMAANTARCHNCGGRATVHRELPATELPRLRETRGMHIRCTFCGEAFHVSLSGLVLSLPEARQFRRQHPRFIAQPEREIEFAGRPAVVTHVESLTGGDSLDIITDTETLDVLGRFANGISLNT